MPGHPVAGLIEGGRAALWKRLSNSVLIGLPLAGSAMAIDHASRHGVRSTDVAVFAIFYVWSGLGLSLGFHRLFSHRSFRAHPVLAAWLCAGGTMGFQGSPFRWALDHRRHHALTDRMGDVHSPLILPDGTRPGTLRGFWHAHTGWMFDRWTTNPAVFGKGLADDPVQMAFTRSHALWLVASLALPYGLGWLLGGREAAWSAMLFGGCLRTTLLHHIVWSVNSFGHRFGHRAHATGDNSRDNLWLALLTFGDGWHNGHHAAARSYRHGLGQGQIDPNARIIEGLQRFGLTGQLVVPPPLASASTDSADCYRTGSSGRSPESAETDQAFHHHGRR